eukprot:CAMPEP_0119309560 /NCGR_PEP_ID=MMETSP1333-20130426/15833_1 /TAXON_ID=418940 /ORGANISM="Scyphosphaera apsteinii, Strain RCC1455" /LENGTH=431 /DNA_ID=CAMNT_0007313553 /DNA_START=140 /DNA_END=1435 /DNA_ORIENTATION=-
MKIGLCVFLSSCWETASWLIGRGHERGASERMSRRRGGRGARGAERTDAGDDATAAALSFLREAAGRDQPRLEISDAFEGDRFPNVVVTPTGAVLLVYGADMVRVRRSGDGGASWGTAVEVAHGIHGGGVTVDELTGHVLIFVEDEHPPAPLRLFRSTDDGLTWAPMPTRVLPNAEGHVMAMHFNEKGLSLRGGQHNGRLLRAARWYAEGDYDFAMPQHYTAVVYSDDHGATWHASEPFPAKGTGEAALAQLSNGSIVCNSRRHWAPPPEKRSVDSFWHSSETKRRWAALSSDGGETWGSAARELLDLPDGPQGSDFGLFGGLARLDAHADILLFSNCDTPGSDRRNGAVWLSFNGGDRWPHKRVMSSGQFGYSSLAAGRAGTPSEGWVYLFFEAGKATREIKVADGYFQAGALGRIARFNMAWLTEGLEL